MNPNDAGKRNLLDGEQVRIHSRVGAVEIPVEICEDIMQGVVSIPHGWGHDREGVRMEIAQQHAGTSINDLTDDQSIDALCGTAAFNGTLVSVTSTRQSEGGEPEERSLAQLVGK
jgi:anaerobic selenocysteine-containing dehydrogenase